MVIISIFHKKLVTRENHECTDPTVPEDLGLHCKARTYSVKAYFCMSLA